MQQQDDQLDFGPALTHPSVYLRGAVRLYGAEYVRRVLEDVIAATGPDLDAAEGPDLAPGREE
jgi:hypothetical protein